MQTYIAKAFTYTWFNMRQSAYEAIQACDSNVLSGPDRRTEGPSREKSAKAMDMHTQLGRRCSGTSLGKGQLVSEQGKKY